MLQTLISGLALGSLYAAVAMMFNLTYQASRVLSMAAGTAFMVGAVGCAFLVGSFNVAMPLAILITCVVGFLLGAATEVVAVRPILGKSDEHLWLLSTLAVATIVQNAVGLFWGTEPRPFPRVFAQSFAAGPLDQKYLLPVAFALILLAVLLLLKRTMIGKVFSAMSEDALAARARGIRVEYLRTLAFGLTGALSALGGMAAAQLTFTYFAIGTLLTLNGFIAIAVGGLGSNVGALIGGWLLGLSTVIAASLFGNEYQYTLSVGLLVLVLMVRPQGLIASSLPRKV